MKKIILFDLDGTLIDSTDAIVSTFYHSFQEMNFDFKGNSEDIKSLIGYPLDIMYIELGVSKDKAWDFVDSYKARYRTISLEQTYLLQDAVECLQLASSFARLAIVTTKTTSYSIPLLENMNIFQYFEGIIGRQEVLNPKPHPEPIFKAIELLNAEIHTNDIYMIGDTKLDLIAARDAGIKGVGVLCGYGKKEELLCYSDAIFDNTLDAVKYIQKI